MRCHRTRSDRIFRVVYSHARESHAEKSNGLCPRPGGLPAASLPQRTVPHPGLRVRLRSLLQRSVPALELLVPSVCCCGVRICRNGVQVGGALMTAQQTAVGRSRARAPIGGGIQRSGSSSAPEWHETAHCFNATTTSAMCVASPRRCCDDVISRSLRLSSSAN